MDSIRRVIYYQKHFDEFYKAQTEKVKEKIDYPLFPNTAYSIELNAAVKIDEWNKTVRIMLEEDGYFDNDGFRYIDGRQREIYTVPRKLEYVR